MLSRLPMIRTLLIWGMIPLTAFGSMPRQGCICADGRHRFFCQRHNQGSESGSCECCHGRDSDRKAVVSSQARTVRPCCAAAQHRANRDGQTGMRSDRPCRPVIDVVLLMTAAKVALVGDTAGLALFIVPDGVSSAPVRSAAHPHLVGDGLPPPDLVIAHQVLLI